MGSTGEHTDGRALIPKAQILALATEQGLLPTTIEKDYALGWVLYAVAQHPAASKWIFKGGTCLKKCFFDTYRFSEPLDFTVPIGEPYEVGSILGTLRDLARWVETEVGIAFPNDGISLQEYENPRGNKSFQGKLSFSGPLQMAHRTFQRVKFDLAQDEILVDPPDRREVSHPYRDASSPAPRVLCYSIDEILAEKSRALYERQGRARDVYDIVHLSRAFRESVDAARAVQVLREKFSFKGLPAPDVDMILGRIDDGVLRANWEHQLEHQLPVLPDAGEFIDSLEEALAWWIEPARAAPQPDPVPIRAGESTAPRELFSYQRPTRGLEPATGPPAGRLAAASSVSMERIRYAARNHLCLRVRYNGVSRLVEPYSLRLPATGNTLLYAWERRRGGAQTGQIKAFKLPGIRDVEVTNQSFVPRFYVEL